MNLKIHICSLIVLIAGQFGYSQAQSSVSLKIDSIISATMDAMPLAGIAIAVVKDGKVVHSKGYGITEVNDPNPVNEHTLFAIASNTKAFTTTALALLVDEGKLAWTDKVIDYIPEFRMYEPYVTAAFNIQDLLTHRSGLGLGAGDLMFFPDGGDYTIDDVLKSFQYQKPVSAFRTKYDYDNLLYLVAGEVIARVSGMSWADFIKTKIMIPLGMKESMPVYQDLTNSRNVAMPHRVEKGNLKQLATYTKPNASLGAAGGIYASVNDLSHWMMMHLHGGIYEGTRLVSPETHEQMWKPYTNIGFKVLPDAPYYSHFAAYGLGWIIQDRKGMICLEHTGSLPGMLSRTILVPELQLGIVVLTNTDPGGYSYRSVSQAILDSYLGIDDQDWVSASVRQIASKESSSDSVTTEVWKTVDSHKNEIVAIDDYTGIYKDSWFGDVRIWDNDGQLWFTSLRSPKLNGPMYFYKGNTFAIPWEYRDMDCDAFATFVLDVEGRAKAIRMQGISPAIDFSFDFQDLDLKLIDK